MMKMNYKRFCSVAEHTPHSAKEPSVIRGNLLRVKKLTFSYVLHKSLFIVYLLLLLISCSNTNDYVKSLGSGFFIRFDGDNTYLFKGEELPESQYRIHYKVILPVLIDWEHDKKYLVCVRKRNNDFNLKEYWIINKKSDKIYGPLTEKRFDEVKDSLRIKLEF